MRPRVGRGLREGAAGLLVALAAALPCGARPARAAAPAGPEVRVGSEGDFSPYTFVDRDGNPAGFGIDLIRAVAGTMGLRLRISVGVWDDEWDALVAGRIDVLPIVSRLPERERVVDFSVPHTETFDAFFVRKGHRTLADLASARGEEIVVMRSDAAERELVDHRFPGRVFLVNTIPQGLALVASGQHDAFLCSKLVGTLETRQHHLRGLVAGPPVPDYKRVFSFAVRKDDADLLEKLNQGLLILKTSGEYDRIYRRWLFADDPWRRWEPYFVPALALVALLLLAVGGLAFGVRWLARRRARELALAEAEIRQEIGERRRAQEALEEANRNLELRVAARTAELQAANTSLADSNVAVLNLLEDAQAARDEAERANARLRASEARLRRFYESGLLGVMYWNMDGRVTEANDKFLEIVGYTREDLAAGRIEWAGMTPPEYREADERSVAELKRTGVNREPFEKAYVRKDGVQVPILIAGAMLDDARTEGVAFVLDITERKRVEEELRRSRTQYQSLIETTGDFIWEMDPEGRYTYCSPQMRTLWGIEPAEMVGRTPFDLMPEKDRESATALFGRLLKSPRPFHGLELSSSDGRGGLIYIETSGVPFFDGNGALLGYRGISRDTTERRRADEALRASEGRFRALATASSDAIYRMSADWTTMAHLVGRDFIPDTESPSATWLERYIPPDDQPSVLAAIRDAVRRKGTFELEHRVLRVDGTVGWTFSRAVPLLDEQGEIVEWFGTAADITERKRAEEALRDSEARFRVLAEAMPQIVWSADASGAFDYYNPRAFEYGGVAPEEIAGWGWEKVIHPDDLPATGAAWRRALESGGEYEIEQRLRRGDGQYRWHLTRGLPIRDGSGCIRRWIGTATDIQERKAAEQELRKLNRTLRALSNSNQALIRAGDEAEFLEAACRIVVEDCGHSMVWIGYAGDDEAKSVRPVASAGFEQGYLDALKITWADRERGRGPTGTAIRTGRPQMCRDMVTDPCFEPWRAAALERGYASSLVLPLLEDDRAWGAMTIYSRQPDAFTDDEITLLTELANDVAYGVRSLRVRAAHREAEEALATSEARYRSLFASMTEGFAVHEIVVDEDGEPCDYRFLEINPAFEQLTGLRRDAVLGRRMLEVLPGEDPLWVKVYGGVALTGEPVHFQHYAPVLRRHYEVFAYRSAPGQFATLFMDVSDRVETERLGASINTVNEIVHSTLDADEILRRALPSAAAALGCDTAAVSAYANGCWTVRHVHGMPAETVGLQMSEADEPHAMLAIQSRQPVAIDDAFTDPRGRPDRLRAWGIRSLLVVPILSRHAPLGVISFNYQTAAFTFLDRHVDFAKKLSAALALALENSRLYADVSFELDEKKRAESALRDAHARAAWLARLPEENPRPVARISADGRVLYCNPESARPEVWGLRLGGSVPAPILPLVSQALASGEVQQRDLELMDRVYSVQVGPVTHESYVNLYGLDTTERRRAEQALEESESRFRLLFEGIQEAFLLQEIITDSAGEPIDLRYLEANPAAERQLGRSRDELIGRTRTEVQGTLDAEAVRLVRRVATGGRAAHLERYAADTGRWYEVLLYSPRPGQVATLNLDITDRKLAERMLQARTAVTQVLADATDARQAAPGMIEHLCRLFDAEGGELWLASPGSDRLHRVGGWESKGAAIDEPLATGDGPSLAPGEGLLGRPWSEGRSAWIGDVSQLPEAARTGICGRAGCRGALGVPVRVGARLLGTMLFAAERAPEEQVLRAGEVLGSQIGEFLRRRQAEDALRLSERKYATILRTIQSGFWYFDLEGRLLDVNEAYCRMSGYSRQELLAMRIPEIEAVESEEEVRAHIREVAEAGHSQFETRHRRKDGTVFDVDIRSTYLDIEGGRIAVFVWDITERKRADAEIARNNAVLAGMNRIFQATLAATSEGELGGACLVVAEEVTGAPCGFVGEIDRETGRLADIAIRDPGRDLCRMGLAPGLPAAPGGFGIHGLYGRVLLDGRSLLTNEPATHPDSVGVPSGHPGLDSFLGSPLVHEGRTIGLVALANRPGGFRDEDRLSLEALARAIVEAFMRRRAETALARSTERFKLLSDVAGGLLASPDPQSLVNALCSRVMAHLDCQVFFNFVADPGGRLRLNAWGGIPDEEARRIEWLDYGVAVCGCVAREGVRIVAEDVQRSDDHRTDLVRSHGVQAYACHPLLAGERVIGTLSFGTRNRTRFQADELALMKTVADQVAVATERIQTQREIAQLNQDLQRRVAELQTIFDTAPIGLAIALDPDGRHIRGNRTNEEMFGLPPGAELSKSAGAPFRLVVGERELDIPELPMQRAVRGETVAAQFFDLVRSDGGRISMFASSRPLFDEEGRPRGAVGAFLDVTALRRAEAEVRESQERLSFALEASHTGAWDLDLVDRTVVRSPEHDRIFGYEELLPEWTYDRFLEHVVPDDRPGVDATFQEAVRTRGDWSFECRIRRADGETRWIWAAGRHRVDVAKNVRRMAGIVQDVTERRRALEDLARARAEAERRAAELAALMDAVPAAVMITHDPEGRMITGNQTAHTMLHVPTESPNLSKSAEPEANPGYRPLQNGLEVAPERLPIQRAARGEPVRNEYYDVVFENGEMIHLVGNAEPLWNKDGTTRGSVGVFADVSELKRAEESLRESEERYRALVELSPEAVMVHREGCLVYANPACVALLGAATEEELLGKPLLDTIHPDDRELVAARARIVSAGGSIPRREIRMLRLDGEEVLAETTAVRIEYRGEPAVQAIVRDIGEQRKLEERLAQAQKMEAIGLLAGGVAHDFNNLLVGVIGNASLAADMMPPGSKVMPLLDRIVRTGEQAAHLTRQLLAYAGKGQIVMEGVDLSQMVRNGVDLVRASVPNKIKLHVDLASGLPLVNADRSQLHQVFMNLVINSAEAIGPGPGQITVRTALREMNEAALREGSGAELRPGPYVCLEVTDDGCGMDEETRSKIFDPFFTTKFLGRGLGLAAVSGIVRSHRGSILVESAPGTGSRFTVVFPPLPPEVLQGDDESPSGELRGAGRILLVDDEEIVLETGQASLERHGYEVVTAASGPAALRVFQREGPRFDLVILDLSMPGMGGEEVLPELKRIRPEVRVVVSSGYSHDDAMRYFKGLSGIGFIQKPYTAAKLAAEVKRALG